MTLLQKTVASVWATVLLVPTLFILFSYATVTCGEYDPCSTGQREPHANLVIGLIAVFGVLHVAYLVIIWRSGADQLSRFDQTHTKEAG